MLLDLLLQTKQVDQLLVNRLHRPVDLLVQRLHADAHLGLEFRNLSKRLEALLVERLARVGRWDP